MTDLQLIEARATALGCEIVAVDFTAHMILCTSNEGKGQSVTWEFSVGGGAADFFCGDYFDLLVEARQSYMDRVQDRLTNLGW